MNPSSFPRVARTFSGLVFSLALAGCFGTGDGPESIPGTPAPPPDPTEQCDPLAVDPDGSPFPLFFERDGANYNFGMDAGFGGGATVVVANPVCRPANATPQVARMQKFAAEIFGGSTLALSQDVDFSQGEVFTMQVWSERSVPVTFKFEDATTAPGQGGIEVIETHTGNGGEWQTLCFEFDGVVTPGYQTNALTLIFDATVLGNADNDPDNWTFYMDAIEQTDVCPGAPTTTLPVDFEDAAAEYQFANFAGGEADVITNPDQSGLNTTTQTARMRKFGGEIFGGSTLALADDVDFTQGTAFTMKVWSNRGSAVPVLFKFEDAITGLPNNGIELTENHTGGGTWEELCYDFGAATNGFTTDSITFIFDPTVVGDADNDPDGWTFYFDEIEQVADCSGGGTPPPAAFTTITFDDPAVAYALRGFGGAEDSSIQADPDDASNNVVQVNRSAAAETFAGTVVSTGANESVADIPLDATTTEMTMRVRSPAAGIPVRLKIENAADPAISVETEVTTTVANGWETLTFDFTNEVSGTAAFDPTATYNKIAVFFNFGTDGATAGAQTFFLDDIGVAATPPPPTGSFETITFDDPAVTYALRGFGGAEDSSVQADPDDASNNVVQVNRSAAAETFAGTVVSTGANESVPDIPLDASNTEMSFRVYAPAAGIPVRLKIENAADPAISVETEATTTVANGWETLTFDFTNEVSGTAAFNPASTYNKIAIFFNFGTDGATAGAQTFFFDDIAVVGSGGGSGSGTIDFESGSATFSDFGGGAATVIANPDPSGINTSSQVGEMRKNAGDTFGGSTLQLTSPVDLAQADNYLMKVRAQREVVVTLKIEPQAVERTATYSGSGDWEELCFDFSDVAATGVTGITLIFDNGVAGDAGNPDPAIANDWIFQFDDIQQTTNACPAPPGPTFETITFDDPAITYTLTDFGGNASTITNDPEGGSNQVVQAVRSDTAATFAGTTVSTLAGDEIPVLPLDNSNLLMTVRVYSPEAGVTVRLKIEDASDAAIFVETDTTTTAVNTWETLTFDFGNPASQAFNEANTYNRITIFFNFGVDGATAGVQNYFFDDIAVAPPPPTFETLTFDDPAVTYTLEDFGGNASSIVNDPTGGTNQVMQAVRGAAAQDFAGTTISTLPGSEIIQPIDANNLVMSARVYSPVAGVTVKLKIEDSSNAGISVEVDTPTTVADAWETLTFDFSNTVGAAFDPANTYNKLSIFFNFGATGVGEQTYFVDDIAVGAGGGGAVGGELAVNGGFEAGDLSGWTIFDTNNNGGSGSVTIEGTEVSEGSFSVRAVAAEGQNPTLKQEFLAAGTVTPGQTVNISFDMKGTAGAGGVIFPELISEGDMGSSGELLETIAVPTAGFTTYSYTPTAGADLTRGITFQIAVVCGGVSGCFADVFIDNVSITLD